MERVCSRKLSEQRGIKNFCKCLNCKEIAQEIALAEVVLFYRMDLCHGDVSHYDPELIFTDRERIGK